MRLRDAIAHVRRDGRQRMATCPAHDDQKPSVSVKSGADGRILLFDHGGCDTDALLAAAGLDWTDVAGGNGRAAPGRPAAEVSWAVRDRNGRLVAVHHRRDLSDGAKRMWWTRGGKTGLGGLRVADLPLYAVDRLGDREPDDKPTFLLEGEPATDALLGVGLSAVGTVTGAASAPNTAPLNVLRGRDVVLWADADAAGRGHMRKLAGLLDGIARVRLLLEEGEDGDDAADWVAARERRDASSIVTELLERVEHEAVNPEDLEEEDGDFDLTDDGLALELGEGWHDARHVAAWNRWLFFKGSRWVVDECLEHMTRGREFLRGKAEAVEASAEQSASRLSATKGEALRRWAQAKGAKLRSAPGVAQVVGLARSNDVQAARVEQWDRDPWLLGTPAGTVDLRTGTTRDPDRRDYITKTTAVAPAQEGTPKPLWDAFLQQAMQDNEELVAYLQRFAGYALTGSVREHAFVFGYGSGANGKGVLTGALQGALGDYAMTVPTDVLMVSRTERHPTEVARLRGVRLAIGSEIEVGRTWAESRIKALTGGDRIAARFMRQDFFEFDPTFKLFVVGNHRPSLRSVDEAIRRRLHLVPFAVTIPPRDRDPALPQKLREEWPGILRWAIEGCRRWQESGLNPPPAVLDATAEYLSGEDTVGRWLEECTRKESNGFAPSRDLFESWKQWAETNGEFVITQKRLGQELGERGYDSFRQPGGGDRGYIGLTLRGPS